MMPEVLYLDNHLLVINKPAGLLAQADRTGDPDVVTLGKAFLKAHFRKPGNVFLGLVHRLDRPASGVMVMARTSKAAARLSAQFRERTVTKEYLCLVEGRMADAAGRFEDRLEKQGRTVRVVGPTQGQRAALGWRLIRCGPDWSLVAVTLETGRPHQIRVQFAHRGHPLWGDFRYGARRPFDGRNLALHCYRLALDHPTRRHRMAWTASLPATWQGPAFAAARSIIEAATEPPQGTRTA